MGTNLATEPYLACPGCISGLVGEIGIAANMAVFIMLGVLVLVLGSFLGFIFYLARKAKLSEVDEH